MNIVVSISRDELDCWRTLKTFAYIMAAAAYAVALLLPACSLAPQAAQPQGTGRTLAAQRRTRDKKRNQSVYSSSNAEITIEAWLEYK